MHDTAKRLKNGALWLFLAAVVAATVIGLQGGPTWTIETTPLDVKTSKDGEQFVVVDEKQTPLEEALPIADSPLSEAAAAKLTDEELQKAGTTLVYRTSGKDEAENRSYFQQQAVPNWGAWSFLPAVITIGLCWITKEPITSLLSGVVVGAFLMGKFNFLNGVLVTSIGTPTAATILILYLWLLGGLMGVWARTGASRAFATYMAENYVRGPRSAKFVAWVLGVVFFQGGTISSVLVGTTVRPLADKERVSHEELSLIVDATSSPIAVLLPFNAWPIYVQSFLTVAGVAYLATEADRLSFFFQAIPLSFYAMFSVLATLLLALDMHPALPTKLKKARRRARETGELDAPGAEPLASEEELSESAPEDGMATPIDFFLPLLALLGIAVGTYLAFDSPSVLWAFGIALLLAALLAWLRGMTQRQIVTAVLDGQKSVILGSVILLLAITIGKVSQDVGAGRYLVSLLGDFQWYWALPGTVFALAVVIAFSTGTCWGTFAVTFPLVMPLAHAVATNHALAHPQLFMSVCFAACLNGGVFGDQCSPISDTTILSSIATCTDLMDHVKTQIPVAAQAAALAVIGWTIVAFTCA